MYFIHETTLLILILDHFIFIFEAVSSAYGVPASYHDLDYGEEILSSHEVSQLAAKVQKYPRLPPSHSYHHHPTPTPAPVVYPAVNHQSPPPPPPPTVIPHPPPPPPILHHDEPLNVPYDPYQEYDDYPIDYEVSLI